MTCSKGVLSKSTYEGGGGPSPAYVPARRNGTDGFVQPRRTVDLRAGQGNKVERLKPEHMGVVFPTIISFSGENFLEFMLLYFSVLSS